jgi:hypothetical protein
VEQRGWVQAVEKSTGKQKRAMLIAVRQEAGWVEDVAKALVVE